MTDINSKTPMDKLTEGGTIYTAGNAREFKTGEVQNQCIYQKSANNVDYASQYALMMQSQLIKIKKEKTLIMIIVRDAGFVRRFARLELLLWNKLMKSFVLRR